MHMKASKQMLNAGYCTHMFQLLFITSAFDLKPQQTSSAMIQYINN